ncbi:MAG: hypothetical protein ABI683_12745 [Ginsengibacter sp.]
MMESNQIIIKLSKDEALVLFKFLSRFNENDNKEVFQDQAEEKALWIIEGELQKILVEPFMPNYQDITKEARNIIRDADVH